MTLLRAGQPYPTHLADPDRPLPPAAGAMDDLDRLAIVGGPVSVTLGASLDVPVIEDALMRGDVRALHRLDFEFTPFWCPECDASYCSQHYLHWDVWDEDFFDSVRGRCPRGHQRILMD